MARLGGEAVIKTAFTSFIPQLENLFCEEL